MAVSQNKGRWRADVRWGGTRHRLQSPQNSEKGARLFEATLRVQLIQDGFIPGRRRGFAASVGSYDTLFVEFAKRWFDTYVHANTAPSTARYYGGVLRCHLVPAFGRFTLAQIDTFMIDQYKSRQLERGVHPKSLNNQLSILRRSLTTALDWKLIRSLPRFQWLKTPPPQFAFLTPGESRLLLAAATTRPWDIMVRLALRTGLRLGELLALRWEDVDFERRAIHVRRSVNLGVEKAPKSNRFRRVPMSTDLAVVLSSRPIAAGCVISSAAGERITHQQAAKGLQRILKTAGLRHFAWHTLRHTFASQLASAGVPIHAIQEFMGHSTLQMTMRYAHLAPSAFQNAVELLAEREQETLPRPTSSPLVG